MVSPQPCFEARGTPLNVLQMCSALIELGYEVHLATFVYGNEILMPGLVYHRVGRLYHRTGQFSSDTSVSIGFSLRKLILDAFLALKVLRLLNRRRYLVVHAVEESLFFVAPLARLFRTPVIADLDSDICEQLEADNTLGERVMAHLSDRLRRLALRSSYCAITVCQSLTDLVRKSVPDKPVYQIEDVPLPTAGRPPDPQRVEAFRGQFGLAGKKVVLYTGNCESYQGVDLLVDAVGTITQKHPDAAIVVVGGEGEQIKKLGRRAKSTNASGNLFLLGKQPAENMPEFMSMADVLVSPRRQGENTPLKIYTYMLSGRPIVATDMSTHTQTLDADSAILVPPTPEGIAEGVCRALDDPAYAARIGRQAQEKVQRDYSLDEFKSRLGEVYASIPRPRVGP